MVFGCSLIPKCSEGSRVITREEYPKIIPPDSTRWSIVKYSDLLNYCRFQELCYEGSFDQYHLIYWYEKPLSLPIPTSKVEFRFAVPVNEFMPDSVFQYLDRRIVPAKRQFQQIIK